MKTQSFMTKSNTVFLFVDNSRANLTGSNNKVLLSQKDNSKSQKQPFTDVFQNRCSQKFHYIHRKTSLLESLFIKKKLQHRCFPVYIAKFLRTFPIEHLWWLLLSWDLNQISNANLNKNKKIFLYFDKSPTNQTNLTKRI